VIFVVESEEVSSLQVEKEDDISYPKPGALGSERNLRAQSPRPSEPRGFQSHRTRSQVDVT
jgi:hypothetical protein